MIDNSSIVNLGQKNGVHRKQIEGAEKGGKDNPTTACRRIEYKPCKLYAL